MIYLDTRENILRLTSTFGTLTGQQLRKFFSDEVKSERVQEQLLHLTAGHRLVYDRITDRYHDPAEKRVMKEVEDRRIQAFWVLAALGSREVMDMADLRYPSQAIFWNTENIAYDITVVKELQEAALAARMRNLRAVEGVEDTVIHMAVIEDQSLISQLKPYGFDVCCMSDPVTHEIRFMDTENTPMEKLSDIGTK